MAKVYAPQVPSRFDVGTRLWIPSMDLSPAAKFGELVIMLPPDAAKAGPAPCIAAIRERMADFKTDDYLIAIGDPSLISAAAIIAHRMTGGLLRQLKWDRYARDYIAVEVKI